jgi:type IV pilus assembly protein PilC
VKLAYKGFDRAGKPVRGHVEAADSQAASDQLHRDGIFVTEMLSAEAQGIGMQQLTDTTQRLRLGSAQKLERVSFTMRQLALLISTGTPIMESLLSLERQQRDADFRGVLQGLRLKVEEGKSLAEAMAAYPDYFDPVCKSLVAAGESSGKLPDMLNRLFQLTKNQARMRKTVTNALVYPSLLICFAFGVLCVMVAFVLPRFEGLFKNLNAPLPELTKLLMQFSHGVRDNWMWIVGGAAIAIVTLALWLRSRAGKVGMDTIMLTFPKVSQVTKAVATARIARVLGTLIEGRVPMLEALALARNSFNNTRYVALMVKAEEAVLRGENLSTALGDSPLMTDSVVEALRSGEKSGQVAPVLLNVADFLDEEAESSLKTLTTLMEPAILVGLGLVVGAMAVGMMLPLFDLTASAGGGGR